MQVMSVIIMSDNVVILSPLYVLFILYVRFKVSYFLISDHIASKNHVTFQNCLDSSRVPFPILPQFNV